MTINFSGVWRCRVGSINIFVGVLGIYWLLLSFMIKNILETSINVRFMLHIFLKRRNTAKICILLLLRCLHWRQIWLIHWYLELLILFILVSSRQWLWSCPLARGIFCVIMIFCASLPQILISKLIIERLIYDGF